MILAAKVGALRAGRGHVSIEDIRSVVLPAMRHRCLLNFEAQAEGVTTDDILTNIIETLPTTAAV
jgi:MoxR-like ATPase